MEVKASLNNLRISPRKARLVANLIKGMDAGKAKAQLSFLIKKPAPLILKLVNSAVANAKHNFNIEASNLYIDKITVEAGATLKRWMPRAMGRASAIRKRTCSVNLILKEFISTGEEKKIGNSKPEIMKSDEVFSSKERDIEEINTMEDKKIKKSPDAKPYGRTGQGKKKAARQTIGSAKRVFRRKSV